MEKNKKLVDSCIENDVSKKIILPSLETDSIVGVTKDDELYKLVNIKMREFENNILIERIKSLEMVVSHMANITAQLQKSNESLKEMLIQTSTNVEEILNMFVNSDMIDEEGNHLSTFDASQHLHGNLDDDDEELMEFLAARASPGSDKLN